MRFNCKHATVLYAYIVMNGREVNTWMINIFSFCFNRLYLCCGVVPSGMFLQITCQFKENSVSKKEEQRGGSGILTLGKNDFMRHNYFFAILSLHFSFHHFTKLANRCFFVFCDRSL